MVTTTSPTLDWTTTTVDVSLQENPDSVDATRRETDCADSHLEAVKSRMRRLIATIRELERRIEHRERRVSVLDRRCSRWRARIERAVESSVGEAGSEPASFAQPIDEGAASCELVEKTQRRLDLAAAQQRRLLRSIRISRQRIATLRKRVRRCQNRIAFGMRELETPNETTSPDVTYDASALATVPSQSCRAATEPAPSAAMSRPVSQSAQQAAADAVFAMLGQEEWDVF